MVQQYRPLAGRDCLHQCRHLARISLLAFVGLLLASITMFVRVHFTFEWGALLVIVFFLGLGQLVGWFYRQNE